MSKKNKGAKPETVEQEAPEVSLEEALDLPVEDTVAAEAEPEFEEGDFPEAEAEEVAEETAEEEVEEVTEEAPVAPAEPKKETAGEVITDDNGAPLFKRMAPNRADNGVTKKERMKPSYKPVTKQTKNDISSNAALLSFPNDRFGITKDVKKALTQAASRIAGDAQKKELVLEVVGILLQHIEVKFKADKAYRAKLAAKNDENE
jgi:hypothetical protein